MAQHQWNGRAVIFTEFNIRKGRAVRAAFIEDGETGSYLCLVESMRYADTNELVFASVNDIEELPFKLQQRIIMLAGEAAQVNGLVATDEDAVRATNGSGEYIPSP